MLLSVHHLFAQRQWQLVELTYRDGLSTREASRRLGISESAVRQRRQRIGKRISAMQARTYARRSETEDAET
jgi:DNA-directed RNA polymerase specialized sigma24 family protein